jgi:hypothetical protein
MYCNLRWLRAKQKTPASEQTSLDLLIQQCFRKNSLILILEGGEEFLPVLGKCLGSMIKSRIQTMTAQRTHFKPEATPTALQMAFP